MIPFCERKIKHFSYDTALFSYDTFERQSKGFICLSIDGAANASTVPLMVAVPLLARNTTGTVYWEGFARD